LANVGDNYQVLHEVKDNENVVSPAQYKISGSITGYDSLQSKSNDKSGDAYGGKGLGQFGLEASNRDSQDTTELTLDLFISKKEARNGPWKIVGKITSSNKLILTKDTKENRYGIRILGIGVNFGENVVTEDGLGYASRLLVEKSLVELLSKLDDLDYQAFEPTIGKSELLQDASWNNHLSKIYKDENTIVDKDNMLSSAVANSSTCYRKPLYTIRNGQIKLPANGYDEFRNKMTSITQCLIKEKEKSEIEDNEN